MNNSGGDNDIRTGASDLRTDGVSIDAVLELVGRGWHIFSLPAGAKAGRSFYNATNDLLALTDEFRQSAPSQNCGIRTGKASGLYVLDVDTKPGKEGQASFDRLCELHGTEWTKTFTVRTASGGFHLYFSLPSDIELRNTDSLYPHIDTRGEGGYVVGPESVVDGKRYVIEKNLPCLDVPAWLAGDVQKHKSRDGKKEFNAKLERDEEGRLLGDGFRDSYLITELGIMRARNWNEESLAITAHTINEKHFQHPLPPEQVEEKIASILNYAPGETPEYKFKQTLNNINTEEEEDSEFTIEKPPALLDRAMKFLKDSKLRLGESTGIDGMDNLFGGGFRAGELSILVALAKTGKSTFFHFLIKKLLDKGHKVAYVSKEMYPESDVMPALFSLELGRNLYRTFSNENYDELYGKCKEMCDKWDISFSSTSPTFVDDKVERWITNVAAAGVQFVFVDHLHLISSEAKGSQDYQIAVKNAWMLKTLAKKLNIHIFLITQPINIQRGDKLNLHSIRGGSQVAQIASNIFYLERLLENPTHSNASRLRLDRSRSPSSNPGEIYLQYDTDTMGLKEFIMEGTEDDLEEKQIVTRASLRRPKIKYAWE